MHDIYLIPSLRYFNKISQINIEIKNAITLKTIICVAKYNVRRKLMSKKIFFSLINQLKIISAEFLKEPVILSVHVACCMWVCYQFIINIIK